MTNLKNKMNKLLFLIFTLSLSSLSFYSYAAPDCVNNGGIKHGTMDARGGTIELKGMIKKNQEVARFTFKRDGSDVAVADCPDGAEFYAYATYSEASGVIPSYYMDIDGRPAYYVVRKPNTGLDDYAYVLIENESGLSFRSQPGQEVPVNAPKLNTRDATVIVYATKDNPKSQRFTTQYIGSILINRFNSGGGTTAVGFSYRLSVNIISAPTSCSAENTNLIMNLPRISTSAFPKIGFPTEQAYAEDHLKINCTGNVSAKIKLMANNTTSYEGQESVIKADNEGSQDNAKGIGFVVTSPLSNDTRLVNNQFVKLADLTNGSTNVPLKAEYFRYGNEVKPGKVNASANFVLEFN